MSKRKIIIVDDNPDVLEILKEKLGDHFKDMEIVDFVDPEQAAIAIENEKDIEALVTDLKMPKLDGRELAKKAQKSKPDLPVFLRTGYSDEMTDKDMKDSGIKNVVSKDDKTDTILMDLLSSLKKEES